MIADDRPLTGVGRSDLLLLIDDLRAQLRTAKERIGVLAFERHTYLVNLTSTQVRCTELLMQLRATKAFGALDRDQGADVIKALLTLGAAICRARTLHPNGCKYFALIEEAGEVARAMRRETPERVVEELIDTAVVAIRLAMGEWDER